EIDESKASGPRVISLADQVARAVILRSDEHVRVETIRGRERDLPDWVRRLAQRPRLIHADPIAAAALLRNIDAVGGRTLTDRVEEGEERASAERHGARGIEGSQARIVNVQRSAPQHA